jgi:SAM-dependent methyltransferase
MDVGQFKERQAVAWGLGDYSSLSRVLAPAARELCDACAVSAGQEVLDVAAGDGNFALACASEGASVVASDLAPAMVERGRARTEADGYDVEWVRADAEALPFGDDSFECVGSVFGAVFTPQPEIMARELFRVVRPGGTVGLTSWTPGSFTAELFGVRRRYVPPPPDLPLAELWGEEDTVRERLDDLAARVETERGAIVWEAESPEAFVDWLERDAPMQVAARKSLSEEQLAASHADHVELVRRHAGGDGAVRIEAEYLRIVARRRG